MSFDFDFTEYDPEGRSILKEGIYLAQVREAKEKTSKTNGDKYLELELISANTKKLLLYDRLFFGEKARNLAFCKLFELGIPQPEPGGRLAFTTSDLVGRRAAILVIHRQGVDQQGKPRTEAVVAAFTNRPPFKFCGYLNEAQAVAEVLVGEAATEDAPVSVDGTPF